MRTDGHLAIEEVFYTIQGEGPFAGIPAVFVRTSGCWLACYWCDTEFDRNKGTFSTPQEILLQVQGEHAGAPCSLIVLTGGDPLRQNILPFCAKAAAAGYHIQIETAGVRWVPGLEGLLRSASNHPGVSIVCSPKTGKVCPEMHLFAAAWKYIIKTDDKIDARDGLPNSSTQTQGVHQPLARPADYSQAPIYLQPCEEQEELNEGNRDLAVSLAMKHGYRISLQQHKILGLR